MNQDIIKSLLNISSNEQVLLSLLYSKLKNNLSIERTFYVIEETLSEVFSISFLKIIIQDKNNTSKDFIFKNNSINNNEKNYIINIDINFDISISYIVILKDKKINKNSLNTIFSIISDKVYSNYLYEKIKEIELIDNVTGNYNRKYLFHYLEKMLPLSQRENQEVAFLMIGLDHFKAVIDEFDYNTGDIVLNDLSKLIKENLRTSDIITRIEADQFLIVLPHVNGEENAMKVASKLIEKFSKHSISINEEKSQILKKSICIGVTLFPYDSNTTDEVLRNADISLYEARNKGRGQLLKFSKEVQSTIDLF